MNKQKVKIDGKNLQLSEIIRLIENPDIEVEIDSLVWENVKKSQSFLLSEIENKIVYGINTGFGPMASYIISTDQLLELQNNLILSHAVGMGSPIHQNFVLAGMVIRLNTLCKGYSGVSEDLINRLKTFINFRIIPIVPEHGAVGTSGDLVQLAHVGLAMLGKGEVFFRQKKLKTAEVLKQLNLPIEFTLGPKEGLAIINGTSMMSGVGSLVTFHAENILNLSIKLGAMALEADGGFSDSIAETVHDLRPHTGQKSVAKILRELLATSRMLVNRKHFQNLNQPNHHTHKIKNQVQEVYSLRCIAQILGPVWDCLQNVKKTLETEINSVTDNPIVDFRNQTFWHGGNFHGECIATAMDHLKIGLAKLSMLSERRINFFMNHKKNELFPPYLNLKTPGLNLALQGMQFVATSTVAQNQSFCFPHSIHSISTNLDNQDVVSMGCDAALMTAKVVENTYIVLAIELISLCQAVDFLNKKEMLCHSSKVLYDSLRKVFPKVESDREYTWQLSKVVKMLKKEII